MTTQLYRRESEFMRCAVPKSAVCIPTKRGLSAPFRVSLSMSMVRDLADLAAYSSKVGSFCATEASFKVT